MSRDAVERTVWLPATRRDVWDALTQAARLSEWFGDVLELDVRPGGRFACRDADGVIRRALIETVDEPSTLTFRWLGLEEGPGGDTWPVAPATVELHLTEAPDGTELTVVETPMALSRA